MTWSSQYAHNPLNFLCATTRDLVASHINNPKRVSHISPAVARNELPWVNMPTVFNPPLPVLAASARSRRGVGERRAGAVNATLSRGRLGIEGHIGNEICFH